MSDTSPNLYALQWTLAETASADETRRGAMVTLHSNQGRALAFYLAQREALKPTFTPQISTNPQGEVGLIVTALRAEDFGAHRSMLGSLAHTTRHWEEQGKVHTLRKFGERGQLDDTFAHPAFTSALRSADMMYLKTGEIVTPPPAPTAPAKKRVRKPLPKPRAGS